jgi:hypothetical protein
MSRIYWAGDGYIIGGHCHRMHFNPDDCNGCCENPKAYCTCGASRDDIEEIVREQQVPGLYQVWRCKKCGHYDTDYVPEERMTREHTATRERLIAALASPSH